LPSPGANRSLHVTQFNAEHFTEQKHRHFGRRDVRFLGRLTRLPGQPCHHRLSSLIPLSVLDAFPLEVIQIRSIGDLHHSSHPAKRRILLTFALASCCFEA
jgi:hypothetical protein